MIKLVMFLGIKPQLVSEFKISNLDIYTNKIFISGYWVHLPDKLGVQMKKYLSIIEKLSLENGDFLFIKKDGTRYIKEYGQMFKVANKVMKNCSAESIAKFTIIQMIKEGINPSIILSITKFGIDTYLHCQDLVNSEKGALEKSRYLDSKLRKMKIFDIL